MKKTLTNQEWQEISNAISVYRASDDVPYEKALAIDSVGYTIQIALKKHVQPKLDLINERKTTKLNAIVGDNETPENKKIIKKIDEDAFSEAIKVMGDNLTIDIDDLKKADYDTIIVKGDKIVQQQNGGVAQFNYRENYFTIRRFILS